MTPDVRPLVAGNWKMNGLGRSLGRNRRDAPWRRGGRGGGRRTRGLPAGDAELLRRPASSAGGKIGLGGQDCHPKPSGAFTGDISAAMLKDAGCAYVIVGHSERRAGHGETDPRSRPRRRPRCGRVSPRSSASAKRRRARCGRGARGGDRRCAGRCRAGRRRNIVVAYEPVWAIGTGLTPTRRCRRDAQGDPGAARRVLGDRRARVRILYGGSVKPQTPRSCSACPMSTARWSAARALRPRISSPSPRPIADGRIPIPTR